MIGKIEKIALQLRAIIITLLIFATIFIAVCYAFGEEEKEPPTYKLAFWPTELVPHPPHFPVPVEPSVAHS